MDNWMSYEELMSLHQTSSIHEFRYWFELLSTVVDNLMEETLKMVFMNGLLEEIKVKVEMFSPRTLKEVMVRAMQVKKKNMILDGK